MPKTPVGGGDEGRGPQVKQYAIDHPGDDYDWLCGRASGGRQVFIYGPTANPLPATEAVAIFFDGEGNLIGSQRKAVPPPEPAMGPGWWQAADAVLRKALAEWQAEIGFVPGKIRVRRFSCEDVLIEDLPNVYQHFLADPLDPDWGDERSRAELARAVDVWVAGNKFVLVFGKEYWMDAEGMIEST